MKTFLRVAVVALVACSSPKDGEEPQAPAGPGNDAGGTTPNTPPPADAAAPPDPKDGNPDTPYTPPVETGPVTFPYTPYKCGYAIRQVSPSKPAAIFHDEGAGAAPTPRNLHLTLPGNASSSVTIQWSTDDATHQTEVRFGDTPATLDKVARGFSFTYGVAGRRQHEVHICGLLPGRTYSYDAGGAAGRSAPMKFTTAPDAATNVTILVAGDSRTDPSVLGSMQTAILAKGPTAMVLTGDAVASGANQVEWDALFGAAPQLFAQLPGYWAHGNHEALDELYFAQNALPDHGGATDLEQWFAGTYGPVRFVALNDTVSSSATVTGSEKTFLDATLAAADRNRTPFVAVMHHQPMYTTSNGHTSNTTIRGAWAPLFDKYHVNVDLAGHVHSYESTPPLRGGTAASVGQVVTDATGTRYFNYGGAGAPLYGFTATQPWIAKRESVHGFAIMTVNATTMTWTAYRADGSTIETIAIPK